MANTKLIIIRGIPGSGKSTLASKLSKEFTTQGLSVGHFEADMFHMIDGQYCWKPESVKASHEWCQKSVVESLLRNDGDIVSNTFTTTKELQPYFKLIPKCERRHRIEVIEAKGNFKNVHDVPEETLVRMASRYIKDIDCLYDL